MTRRSLIFTAIALTTVVCTVPAGATQTRVTVQGSVLLSHGHLASVDRALYTGQGCAQDIRDGRTGAYLDVRGFDILMLRVGVSAPGATPKITGRLYGTCDPAVASLGIILGTCEATPTASCSVQISNARYVEISIDDGADVHFTVTLINT